MAKVSDAEMATEQKEELQAEGNEAAAFLQEIRSYEIRSQDDLEFLAASLKEIKGKRKYLEDKRKSVTAPLMQAVNTVRSWFDMPEGYYKLLEVELKDKIAKAESQSVERNARALAAAELAHKQGNRQAVNTALSTVHTLNKVPGLSTREQWDFEVEDEGLVPREYLTVNPKAIRDAMRTVTDEEGNPKSIPGVKYFKRTVVSSRSA